MLMPYMHTIKHNLAQYKYDDTPIVLYQITILLDSTLFLRFVIIILLFFFFAVLFYLLCALFCLCSYSYCSHYVCIGCLLTVCFVAEWINFINLNSYLCGVIHVRVQLSISPSLFLYIFNKLLMFIICILFFLFYSKSLAIFECMSTVFFLNEFQIEKFQWIFNLINHKKKISSAGTLKRLYEVHWKANVMNGKPSQMQNSNELLL